MVQDDGDSMMRIFTSIDWNSGKFKKLSASALKCMKELRDINFENNSEFEYEVDFSMDEKLIDAIYYALGKQGIVQVRGILMLETVEKFREFASPKKNG